MSVKLPNGIISRSLPEQVGKNMRDIEELKTGYNQISNVAIVEGHLIVTLQDGTEYDTGAVKGIDTIAFNGSKHLIVTYDDGTTADLGLIKGVSSMSIDGSQHLIVTYDNGTSEDLGAIFSGDITITGTITTSGFNVSGPLQATKLSQTEANYTLEFNPTLGSSFSGSATRTNVYCKAEVIGNLMYVVISTKIAMSADLTVGANNFILEASSVNVSNAIASLIFDINGKSVAESGGGSAFIAGVQATLLKGATGDSREVGRLSLRLSNNDSINRMNITIKNEESISFENGQTYTVSARLFLTLL